MATVDLTRLRIGIALAISLLLAYAAGGAFDAVQWPLFAPVVVVGASSLLSARLRLAHRVVVALVSIGVGTASAVLLAGGSVGDIVDSLVRGPRQLITTEWPSPAVPTVVGVVAVLVAAVTAVAADLAGRRHLHLAPLAPLAVGWGAILAIGAPVRPAPWVVIAVGVLSLALALARQRVDQPTRPTQFVLADRTLAVTVAGVLVASIGTATAVAWADRADPRRTEDADVNAPVIDPIEEMIALRRADPSFSVFAIADRSRLVGQSLPARWRTAALDVYDGQRWVPRLTLRPIGGRLGLSGPVEVDQAPPIRYLLEFLTDDLDVLPFPGPPLSASIDVETDLDRVVVRALERPVPGATVLIESEIMPTSRSRLAPTVATRPVDELTGTFESLARRLSGDGSQVERLRRIEEIMRDEWELDRDAPGGGQQLALLERFLADTQRGTEEQFVTGFVLLARSLGANSRVATGFIAPPESMQSPLELTSDMAAVWPEVQLADGTWVAFDPVPDTEAVDDAPTEPPPDAQTPAAAQPPIAPPVEEVDEDDDEVVEVESSTSRWADIGAALVRVGAGVGLGLLPLAIAIGVILGLKWSRRRRRLRLASPALRIRGVWASATDSLVDAGLAIGPSWTDDGIAEQAAGFAPGVPHELRRLAAMSTQMTFGPTGRADALVDDAVFTAAAVDEAIKAQMTRRERIRWRLSLRSLRPKTKSPVDVPVRRRRR